MHPPGECNMDINNWQIHEAIPNRYARAGAAAGPYAEFINGNQHSNWHMSNGLRFIQWSYIK